MQYRTGYAQLSFDYRQHRSVYAQLLDRNPQYLPPYPQQQILIQKQQKKNDLNSKSFSKINIYFPPSKLNNPPAILPSSREPPPGVCGAAANTLLANLLNGSD